MYFIQTFVYLFQNSIATPQINPFIPTFPSNLPDFNTVFTDFLATATISGQAPRCVKSLVYTSVDKNAVIHSSYGGYILEYIFNGRKTSFIILRGTQLPSEWRADSELGKINPLWLPTKPTVMVHNGFNTVYTTPSSVESGSLILRTQIFNYLNENNTEFDNIIIAEHSLGGGIAYLLAEDISVNFPSLRSITKFFPVAGPYSGNQDFINLITQARPLPPITQLFAIVNTADAVPTKKLPFYARIPSQLFFYTDKGVGGSYPHLPLTYRNNLEAAASKFDTIGTSTQISFP